MKIVQVTLEFTDEEYQRIENTAFIWGMDPLLFSRESVLDRVDYFDDLHNNFMTAEDEELKEDCKKKGSICTDADSV